MPHSAVHNSPTFKRLWIYFAVFLIFRSCLYSGSTCREYLWCECEKLMVHLFKQSRSGSPCLQMVKMILMYPWMLLAVSFRCSEIIAVSPSFGSILQWEPRTNKASYRKTSPTFLPPSSHLTSSSSSGCTCQRSIVSNKVYRKESQ